MTIPRNLSFLADGASSAGVLGVANGGTGLTASSGANSVMLRDANQNVSINRLNQSSTTVTAAGTTTTLTAASTFSQILSGTGGQTFRLPDATTLTNTTTFEFNNNATGTLTIVDNASGAVGTIASGGAAGIALLSNGTVAGTWDVHAYIPANVQWGTNSLALGSTVISGGTWQGGTIASGYGGTGLTTFSAANNALYSTSASALAAGTLPVLAGGTGVTTSTGTGSVVLSTSPTLTTPALGTPASGTLTSCTGLPLTTGVTGTLAVGNGGTGLATTPANGALDIGNGTGFTRTTLTAGTGISVTNASGGITITNTSPSSGGTVTSVTGTAPVVSSGGNTPAISMPAATTSVSGYLTSTDWNTFNGKVSTAVTSAVAGTGISVSASTGAVTFTNSGVTSAVAGTGITVSGATGAVTVSIGQAVATSSNVQFNSLGVGTAGSATAGEIRATNNITAYYSDERLKTKVGNIENALDKVKQIETMVYHANDVAVGLGYDASIIEVGVTAQSVQKVMPQVVVPAPIDDKYLTVRYEKLVPLLIEAIKELEAQVTELKAK